MRLHALQCLSEYERVLFPLPRSALSLASSFDTSCTVVSALANPPHPLFSCLCDTSEVLACVCVRAFRVSVLHDLHRGHGARERERGTHPHTPTLTLARARRCREGARGTISKRTALLRPTHACSWGVCTGRRIRLIVGCHSLAMHGRNTLIEGHQAGPKGRTDTKKPEAFSFRVGGGVCGVRET